MLDSLISCSLLLDIVDVAPAVIALVVIVGSMSFCLPFAVVAGMVVRWMVAVVWLLVVVMKVALMQR